MGKSGDGRKIEKPKVQSTLALAGLKIRTKTCADCGMTYHDIKKDIDLHHTHHKRYLQGEQWSYKNEVLRQFPVRTLTAKGKEVGSVVVVNVKLELQIRRVQGILDMVNLELAASLGSDEWKTEGTAKTFLVVINNHVIGLCTTETIQRPQCKWMVYKTQTIVPNQTNSHAMVGISRIWVARNWRRYGIAMQMLESVMESSIYGVQLQRQNIAFSQPSTSGGKLALKFNGVKHKSGEMLIPVYLE